MGTKKSKNKTVMRQTGINSTMRACV